MAEQLTVKIPYRGVTQLVWGATHSWPGQSYRCLDLIFTNKPNKNSEVKLTTTYSDYKLIQVTHFAKGLKTTPRYTTKRCYENFDENQFIREVNRMSWFDVYMSIDQNIEAERLLAGVQSFV